MFLEYPRFQETPIWFNDKLTNKNNSNDQSLRATTTTTTTISTSQRRPRVRLPSSLLISDCFQNEKNRAVYYKTWIYFYVDTILHLYSAHQLLTYHSPAFTQVDPVPNISDGCGIPLVLLLRITIGSPPTLWLSNRVHLVRYINVSGGFQLGCHGESPTSWMVTSSWQIPI